ncbi:hypothetical protein [Dactylosporangium sp. CA-139066]|uniref:hypothetical protein n=1 Tax=Dactylosporangium sp. CA-139066 TaxID=3239930 RepID=UPI003D90A1BC
MTTGVLYSKRPAVPVAACPLQSGSPGIGPAWPDAAGERVGLEPVRRRQSPPGRPGRSTSIR